MHAETVEGRERFLQQAARTITLAVPEQDRGEVDAGTSSLRLGAEAPADGDRPFERRDRLCLVAEQVGRDAEHARDERDEAAREDAATAIGLREEVVRGPDVDGRTARARDLDHRDRPCIGPDHQHPRELRERFVVRRQVGVERVDVRPEERDAGAFERARGLGPDVERVVCTLIPARATQADTSAGR